MSSTLINAVYILPMILGRTFDAHHDRVGIDIFPTSALEQRTKVEKNSMHSDHKFIESTNDKRDLLQISGDLSVKIKADKVKLSGTGTYLKENNEEDRTVEILTKVQFETVTESLSMSAKPIEGWNLYRPEDLGTHYVKSVTYGGELLASVKFRVHSVTDFKTVKAKVKIAFGGKGSVLDLTAEGNLNIVRDKLEDKASMDISYFANVPLNGVPNTIEGLRDLVKGFETHVKEVNNGYGVPIRVDLADISNLGEGLAKLKFKKNSALQAELLFFETEFDDLRISLGKLKSWFRRLPASISPEKVEKIDDLYQRIKKILREYYKAIGDMDVTQGSEQLQEARNAYKEQGYGIPSKFTREVNRLMNETVIHEKGSHSTGSTTYIRWGRKECPKTSPKLAIIESGYMAITNKRGTGGSSQYLCLPENPHEEFDSKPFGLNSATVAGVKYGKIDPNVLGGFTKEKEFYGLGVPCANCHVTNRTLVHTFPAANECPRGWIAEYSGVLMSGSNHPGTHICVDENPKTTINENDSANIHSLECIHVDANSFPLPAYTGNTALQCIVCSR